MESNLSDAIYLAFGALVFVLALSITMNLFGTFNTYSKRIIDQKMNGQNKRNSPAVAKDDREYELDDKVLSRYMTKGSVVSLLSRYYKETVLIKLYDKDGPGAELKQVFDIGLEEATSKIASKSKKEVQKLEGYDREIYETFCDPNHILSMFGAPWRGSNASKEEKDRFSIDRVNTFVLGNKKYINGILVDYESNGRDWFSNISNDAYFKVDIVQYQYSGNVKVFDEEGEYGEDIVVGAAPQDKIEIDIMYVGNI